MANKASDKETEISELKSELEKAELQQKISDARKKTAENEKAALKAELPDSDVKALEGKLTADDKVAIECQILTYKAMSEIASQISIDIKKTDTNLKCAIIYNQEDLNLVLSYKTFMEQIKLFKKQYEEALKPVDAKLIDTVAAFTAVSSVLKSLVDFGSLFRSDIDIKGKEVTIVYESLVSEVAGALKSNGITAIYPGFINTVPEVNSKDGLLALISELSGLRGTAEQKIAEWSKNESLKDKVAQLKNLNSQYEKLLSSLICADEKTGISRLDKLIKGEILSSELYKEGTNILYLKIAAGGGSNKVTRNLWNFLGRRPLSHSGGAIITYFLLSKDGAIKSSRTFYNTTGDKKFKNSGGTLDLNNFGKQ